MPKEKSTTLPQSGTKKEKKEKKERKTGPGQCNLCPRYIGVKSVCMQGYGPSNPKLVVIAEAPSKYEDVWCRVCNRIGTTYCTKNSHQIGVPLVGPAGQLLHQVLIDAGYDPNTVYRTNIARCGNKPLKPDMTSMRKCRNYLWPELLALDMSQCDGIILLGESALRGFFGDGKLTIHFCRLKELEKLAIQDPVLRRIVERKSGTSLESSCTGLGGSTRQYSEASHMEMAHDDKKRPRELPRLSGSTKLGYARTSDSNMDSSYISLIQESGIIPIRVTYHPSAALGHHDPLKYDEIVEDIRTAFMPRDPVKEVFVVSTTNELEQIFGNSDCIAIDAEWFSRGALRVIGLSDGKTNVASMNFKTAIEWLERRSGGKGNISVVDGGDNHH